MRRNIILGIIVIVLTGILTGSCNQKKNQSVRWEGNKTLDSNKESQTISEADTEFYSEIKKLLRKTGIYPYDSPLEAHYHDFTLENLDGKKVSLSDFDGQTILLNFWATWCGPCISEMPSMEELYKELKDEGFVIVSIDLRESKASVEKLIKKVKVTFPVLLDTTGEIGSIYSASSIPISYLIDTKGYVVGVALGAIHWNTDEIKNAIMFIQSRGK